MTQIVVDRIPGTRPMSAGSAPVSSPAAMGPQERLRPRPARRKRPARGSGRTAAPILRPTSTCPPPTLSRRPVLPGRACTLPAPAAVGPAPVAESAPSWRLTERGVAVVLVAGAMIMVAALTVVGLTALRVTSAGYQAQVSATLPR